MALIPHGLRLANPGNIRKGSPWKGLVPDQLDPAFCTFVSPEYGIRAIMVILANYEKQGINTISAIIHRWAPPSENNTDAYISSVSKAMGLPANALVAQSRSNYIALAKAIIRHENGQQPYPDDVFNKAWELSGL